LNPGYGGGKSATNRLSYGAASGLPLTQKHKGDERFSQFDTETGVQYTRFFVYSRNVKDEKCMKEREGQREMKEW
jgi:CRISPR/Cas system-associated protein endoribonuclease Cas2